MISQTGYWYISVPGIFLGSLRYFAFKRSCRVKGQSWTRSCWVDLYTVVLPWTMDIWIGCDWAVFRTFWLQLVFFSVLKNMNFWPKTKHGKANPKCIWPQNWEQWNEEWNWMAKVNLSNKWCWILSVIPCNSLLFVIAVLSRIVW